MSKSVLIVRMTKNIAELLRLYLEKEGFSVAWLRTAEPALWPFRKLPRPGPACYNARNGRMGGLRRNTQAQPGPQILVTAKARPSTRLPA